MSKAGQDNFNGYYKLEMHAHTGGVFRCCEVDADQVPLFFKRNGYGGVVITNHFFKNNLLKWGLNWSRSIDKFYSIFSKAKEAGDECGIKVFFGIELSLDGNVNDILIYGLTKKLLKETRGIFDFDYKQLYEWAEKNELLLYQAHPSRHYCTFLGKDVLHGVEAYNGTKAREEYVSCNERAVDLAKKYGMYQISGSDFHGLNEKPTGGILVPNWVKTGKGLVKFLKMGQPRMIGIE